MPQRKNRSTGEWYDIPTHHSQLPKEPVAPVPKVGPQTGITRLKSEAELRNTQALARKHEIEVAQLEGRVVEVSAVLDAIRTCNAMVIARLQTLPARLTPILTRPNIRPHEIEEILREAIREALNELAYAGAEEQ